MSDRPHIGLDNPAFRGRLRQPTGPAQSSHVSGGAKNGRPSAKYFNDFSAASTKASTLQHRVYNSKPKPAPGLSTLKRQSSTVLAPILSSTPAFASANISVKSRVTTARPKPPVAFDLHKPQHSQVLKRQVLHRQLLLAKKAGEEQEANAASAKKKRLHYSRTQLVLMSMAMMIFLVGIAVSFLTLRTNNSAATQVAALSKAAADKPATSDTSVPGVQTTPGPPSTVRPSARAVSNYAVGPDLPRYLDIPGLGVHARVLSLGILNSGALATPNNVFDVGWYNESSKPGQPGAMLIDGHVSSWTSHGVFYGIKLLKPGDKISVERGDGTVVNYQVVKSQVFDHNDVDMASAIRPVDPTKPGLNLITCTGDVIKGTSEFNERIIVYASEV